MATTILNPAVPPNTGESPGNGATRIRALTQAFLNLFNLTANAALPPITITRLGPYTNRVGNALVIGDLVTIDPANDSSVIADDTAASARTFVVALDDVANGDAAVFGGAGDALVHTFGVVARGNYIRKSSSAGGADGGAAEDTGLAQSASSPPAGAIGVALTSSASVVGGQIRAILWGFTSGSATTVNLVPSASAAANRAALQAAIDALPAAGGRLRITTYGNHIDAQINVSKPVAIEGPGTTEVSTPGPFVLILDTASQIGFNVTAKGPFVMRDMSISAATGCTHIKVAGPTGTLKGTVDMRLDNVVFNAGAIQVDLQAAIFERITLCTFWNPTVAAVKVQNLLDGDQGDSAIENCVFSGPQTTGVYGVLYLSGGGLKIKNNKFLGFDAAIAVDPTTTATDPATISDLMIEGNSIESFKTRGIFLTRTAGALVPSQIDIVNNQISKATGTGTVGIQVSPAGAAGDAYVGILITGNYISQALVEAIQLRQVSGVLIAGNIYAVPGGILYDVDSTVVNLTIGVNNDLDYTTFMVGTPGINSYLKGGVITVAQLPPVVRGYCYALDALGPGEGGYTAGNAATGGGGGANAWVRFGTGWRA